MFFESDGCGIRGRIAECLQGIANARTRGDNATQAYFVNEIGEQRRWLIRWKAWMAREVRDGEW